MPVRFAAVGLDHAHIFGMIAGLMEAGAELVGLASDDPEASVCQQVRTMEPDVPWFDDASALINDPSIDLIATAAIPVRRGEIAIAALEAGKDVLTDKPGVVTYDQLETIKKLVAEKGRFWDVVFSERFNVKSAIKAGELVHAGRIGRVVQTLGLGPHRERDKDHLSGGSGRPDWFYDITTFGGILNDIASHQIDQFLWLTGSSKGDVVSATVANFNHPDHPDFQDFGDMTLASDTAQGYVRVDWFTPQGLPTWGDGRLVIIGTEGYIELRKYVDIEGRPGTDHLFVADQEGTEYIDCSDVKLTFFADVLADVTNRTNTAVPQEHTFEVSRLGILAQEKATVRKLF
ncbi:MAG TPA: Gfo/Idh/MocA family oxidoreductase [Propionibacteriaceae bacterium]|nr:Gfo/Idh/MocA family oxidoreductase [Propionibacteriaceae bacterium]